MICRRIAIGITLRRVDVIRRNDLIRRGFAVGISVHERVVVGMGSVRHKRNRDAGASICRGVAIGQLAPVRIRNVAIPREETHDSRADSGRPAAAGT
jgi:hypothetical protein